MSITRSVLDLNNLDEELELILARKGYVFYQNEGILPAKHINMMFDYTWKTDVPNSARSYMQATLETRVLIISWCEGDVPKKVVLLREDDAASVSMSGNNWCTRGEKWLHETDEMVKWKVSKEVSFYDGVELGSFLLLPFPAAHLGDSQKINQVQFVRMADCEFNNGAA